MEEEVTLEKIDMLRSRTNISYKEAKEALELHHGNVIEALIALENRKQEEPGWTEEFTVKSTEAIDKVKELIREGNVHRIRIKSDDKVIAEIPVYVGAIGALLVPQMAALGFMAALFKKCTIEVIRKDDIVDVEPTEETVDREEDK
jgi:translation initiation factor IF-1